MTSTEQQQSRLTPTDAEHRDLSVPIAIHHTVVVVGDLETSLRFYRDGLGLHVLQDRRVEGDWPGLFDAPSHTLRAVFLGEPQCQMTTLGS